MTRRPVPRALRHAARGTDHADADSLAPPEQDVQPEVERPRPSPRPSPRPRVTEPVEPVDEELGSDEAELSDDAEFSDEAELTDEAEFSDEAGEFVDLKPKRTSVTVALAVVTALVIGLAGWMFWLDHQATATDRARRDGLAASVTAAQTILSYDHRRIDADIAAATRLATGKFRTDYADTSKTLVPVAKQYRAVVKATVKASSVVRADPDRVVTLLFVDQATQSTRVQGTKVDLARVRVTMVKSGDAWRVSQVEAL